MNILTIDTADKDSIIILQQKNELIDYITLENNKHTETLLTNIEDMLLRSKLNYKNLDCISIVNGPGSFMGLKISVSTAKAILCTVPNIKIITNNIFEIISHNKNYDFIILEAGLEGFYICDRNNNYFYKKKGEFYPNKNEIIVTNSLEIVDFLKEYNIIYSNSKKLNVINLNYIKYCNNIFNNKELTPLYIREPQINKKYE